MYEKNITITIIYNFNEHSLYGTMSIISVYNVFNNDNIW